MTITLPYDYLRYDIEQLVNKYSFARIDDKEKRYEANLRSEDLNDGDLIRRLVASATGKLRQSLSGYLEFTAGDASSTLTDNADAVYVFRNTVYADPNALASVMHLLVVRYAISSWCAMQGNPTEAEREMAEADRYELTLKNSIHRVKPRRPGTPPQPPIDEDLDPILPPVEDEGLTPIDPTE